uniref:Uncharacterized protein n=1 Tax=Anguilla anguilla TaxID=7936 RepID=A0A0E9Y291_ANGAN
MCRVVYSLKIRGISVTKRT